VPRRGVDRNGMSCPKPLASSRVRRVGEGTREAVDTRIARLNRQLELTSLYLRSVEDQQELVRLRERASALELELARARAEVQAHTERAQQDVAGPVGPSPLQSGSLRFRGAEDGLPRRKEATSRPPAAPRASESPGLQIQVDLHMPSIPSSLVQMFAMSATPLHAVSIRNGLDSTRQLRITSQVEGYSAHAVTSVSVAPGALVRVEQFPPFFCERCELLNELAVAALHIEVEDIETDKTRYHRSFPIRLMARQTAVLYQLDPTTGKYRDLRHYLAAWVTPNSRPILEFLRKAADFSSLKAMHGYQVDAAGVLEHVRAIYDALKAAEITYVNTVGAFGSVEGQFIQRVRLPSESLASRSANCIDGTVLMASLLEATGIAAAIVLVPGHAYLGWLAQRPEAGAEGEEDPENIAAWSFAETTLIGKAPFERACEVARANAIDFQARGQLKILPIARLRDQGVTPME
jgi:hypothetical protein